MNPSNPDNPVSLTFADRVAVITIDNPPVNALSHAVRSGLVACIKQVVSSRDARAIALVCAGRTFIAGADITEFGKPPQEPLLPDVLQTLDECPLPVIAGLHGTALGGGLETALAAHYRVAQDTTRIGLPEVSLGLIPGAGGTQRLPRIAGLENALKMITSGRQVGAKEALDMGIIDRLCHGADLLETVMDFARQVVSGKKTRPRISETTMEDSNLNREILQMWKQRLAAKARGQESPLAALEAIEHSLALPFQQGLEKEREIFLRCMNSAQSKALRYLFFAQNAAMKLPKSITGEAMPVTTVAVIGAGTMGRGIAMCFANKDIPVTLIETNQQQLEHALGDIEAGYAKMAESGRISIDQKNHRLGLITGGCELAALGETDLVVEAAFENLEVKQDIFRSLDQHCRPAAILATNTSYLDIEAIASAVRDPSRVLGMHFFSPAHIMKLLEVVRTGNTSSNAIATVMRLGKILGKQTVLAGNAFGFAANRMYSAYGREGQMLLLEGVTPKQLDRAMQNWGMAMGPAAVLDMSGIDIGYNARKQNPRPPADPCYFRPANLLAELGYLGRKTGRGFYRYDPVSGQASEDEEVIDLIRDEAIRLGVRQTQPTETDIQQRMIRAISKEGTSILADGIVGRESDLDVIWVNGYGFPRWRGGPMHHATEQGWLCA